MQEFDLEGGIKPIERPKLTDFCAKCRLEVPRSVKFCPRCGFDIDGFRNLDGSLPVTKPRTPTAQARVGPASKTTALAIAAAALVVGGVAAWWLFRRARPETPAAAVPRAPRGDQGYVRLQSPEPAPTESQAMAEEPVAKEPKEPQGGEGRARPAAAPAGPTLGRAAADPRLTSPTPAFYRVVLTDGTVYDAISPPGDGSMVTLQLVNGTRVVVHRSDIDFIKTHIANEDRAPAP